MYRRYIKTKVDAYLLLKQEWIDWYSSPDKRCNELMKLLVKNQWQKS